MDFAQGAQCNLVKVLHVVPIIVHKNGFIATSRCGDAEGAVRPLQCYQKSVNPDASAVQIHLNRLRLIGGSPDAALNRSRLPHPCNVLIQEICRF